MELSLKSHHLHRYRDIATLLIKYRCSEGSRGEESRDPSAVASPTADDDARKLVTDLESMGPTFVKLGQLLSTRSDLLPPTYLRALARLQDDVEPIPFAAVESIVTAEVGTKISKAFGSFDSTPLASASLGQVHRATLRDGRPVAVKVQRPGVKLQVIDDMEVIEELAAFVDSHTKMGREYRFGGMVEEFRHSIMAELDYRLEAANLKLLGENLEPYPRLLVPQPVDDYTTGLMLTMDLVQGRNIGTIGRLGRMDVDGAVLAGDLFDAYLDQILLHGFVHADPHPGNVLLTDDGRLALLDLGMVTRVSPELQDALLHLLLAISENDGRRVATLMAALAQKRSGWDEDTFSREIVAIVQQHQVTSAGQLQAGRLVSELARIAGDCGLRPPPELTMISKALLNLDQVAARLDPEFDPNAAIRRRIGEIMRRKLTRGASPANMLAAAMEAKEFAERLPGRVNKVMDALAEGEFTLNVQGIDEQELMRGIQKLANRVTTGVIVAALIIGAALLMRIDTRSKLFGYPALAIVFFLAAAAAGIWLIANSVLHDLPQRRR